MIVRTIAKLLTLLNSNRRAGEIGAAVAFGLWLAFVPATNLVFAALALVVFLAKVNLGMALVSTIVFSMLLPAVDPLLDQVGYWILTRPALREVFTTAYALPVVPFTRFNHTLVSGGLVAGAVLFVPVTGIGAVGVKLYRKHIHERVANSRLVKAFLATPFAQKVNAAVRRLQRVWPTTA